MNEPIVPSDVRRIYQGRIFTVTHETLTLPGGAEFRADIIRHPGSVVIVPVTGSGEVVLVRQYRPAIGRFAWELPAGSLKPGEDPGEAARRECQEEIGLVADSIERLGAFFPTPGYCDEEMSFYRATGLRKPQPNEVARPDEDEEIVARPFSIGDFRRMIGAGEIIDLKTVAGLALIGAY